MGKHIPVLLNEAIELLNIRDGGTYLDLTLGRAGHSSEIPWQTHRLRSRRRSDPRE